MATIRAYTDISQSKKLAEILPLESADMYWWYSGKRYYIEAIDDGDFNEKEGHIRAWSLAALMNLLPSEFTEKGEYSETTYKIDIRKYALTKDVDIYQIAYGNYHWHDDGSCSWLDMINTCECEELIDVAFKMICWLKENNKL